MNYDIFDKTSGQILRCVDCPESMIDYQLLNENESYIDGLSNDDYNFFYVENSSLVPFPDKPNEWCVFDYTTKSWVEDFNLASKYVISKRNQLLYESDWTQLPNGPLTIQQQQQWADYRQQLRDITDQQGYPFNVVWPVQP